MVDRPILFSAPMVRALLDGRKTQTRRVLKPQPPEEFVSAVWAPRTLDLCPASLAFTPFHYALRRLPRPGDRLWVREAWRVSRTMDAKSPRDLTPRMMTVMYEAGGSSGGTAPYPKDGSPRPLNEYEQFDQPEVGQMPDWAGRLRASMHMPRWASRLTLTVTEVRVQRLRDISVDDAEAEGIRSIESRFHTYVSRYKELWDHLNATRGFGWSTNPWIAAVSFTVDRRNIDQVAV